MQIIDYVIIGFLALGLVIGAIKGLLKQILALLGVVVIFTGTAYLGKFPQSWLSGVITNETVCTIVAFVATFVVISVVYGLLSFGLRKLFTSIKIIKVADKICGLVLGIVVVYAVFGVVIALLTKTGEAFLPRIKELLKDQLANSFFVNKIYANNFFGDWILNIIRNGLNSVLPQ